MVEVSEAKTQAAGDRGRIAVFPGENHRRNEHNSDYRTLGTGAGKHAGDALLRDSVFRLCFRFIAVSLITASMRSEDAGGGRSVGRGNRSPC